MKYKMSSLPKREHRKNGRNACGKKQYRCKDCGAYKVLEPTVRYDEAHKEEILRAYQERSSLRGLSQVFGVSRPTVTAWLKKTPAVAEGAGHAGQGQA